MSIKDKMFGIYTDTEEVLNMLSDEQAGKLFKSLYPYWNFGTILETNDQLLQMAFITFRNKLDLFAGNDELFRLKQSLKGKISGNGNCPEIVNSCKILLEKLKDYEGSAISFKEENMLLFQALEKNSTTVNHGQPQQTAVNHNRNINIESQYQFQNESEYQSETEFETESETGTGIGKESARGKPFSLQELREQYETYREEIEYYRFSFESLTGWLWNQRNELIGKPLETILEEYKKTI